MTREVRTFFQGLFRERPGIGQTPIFPSLRDASRPVSYEQASSWLRRAEKIAKLEPLKGGRWHPYRRRWATERKHLPDVDVAAAGGWANVDTMKKSYQHADPRTTLEVLENPKAVGEAR